MSIPDEKWLLYLKEKKQYKSLESFFTQKLSKSAETDSTFLISTPFESVMTFTKPELQEKISTISLVKNTNWEFLRDGSQFPPRALTPQTLTPQTLSPQTLTPRTLSPQSLDQDELDILKVNLSIHKKDIIMRESQLFKTTQEEEKRKKINQLKHKTKQKFTSGKVRDLLTEIEESEYAKKDTVVWKFLKRGSSLRRDFANTRKFLMEIQAACAPAFHFQSTQPTKITCPNCRFYVTTDIKQIPTTRTKISTLFLTIFGQCTAPHLYYTFKDTVHLCPLCKVYLGFSPAFGIREKKTPANSSEESISTLIEENKITETKSEIMVSASSTSAKNLFVESKLRLSDRVQVNVNNIAAIARQIQRGSKSNENLLAAAKNFALQEAAIENSETNLKKLKLLSTHLNNQLDSLHNSSMKMELVLEQVRSMQRDG